MSGYSDYLAGLEENALYQEVYNRILLAVVKPSPFNSARYKEARDYCRKTKHADALDDAMLLLMQERIPGFIGLEDDT